uniref:Uncharacterized protein n=1 Tax=Erwinia amylovora ATCC BAA-2158 TaxID=889211 RepID=E5B6P6_ERWAM|nr:hypothetical protein predicted by Glimmer/Critica [Erwinia amylovora ATCC BAA-2158]
MRFDTDQVSTPLDVSVSITDANLYHHLELVCATAP